MHLRLQCCQGGISSRAAEFANISSLWESGERKEGGKQDNNGEVGRERERKGSRMEWEEGMYLVCMKIR